MLDSSKKVLEIYLSYIIELGHVTFKYPWISDMNKLNNKCIPATTIYDEFALTLLNMENHNGLLLLFLLRYSLPMGTVFECMQQNL